jgi:hypothetical protein
MKSPISFHVLHLLSLPDRKPVNGDVCPSGWRTDSFIFVDFRAEGPMTEIANVHCKKAVELFDDFK